MDNAKIMIKVIIFATQLISLKYMNFNNTDNTVIFDEFLQRYKNQANLSKNIKTYSSSYENGSLSQAIKGIAGDDSPYICHFIDYEIMRSVKCCDICVFTQEEEFALIAHELGHLNAYDKGLNLTVLNDEMYADRLAVHLGLRDAMISALLKMKKANLNLNQNNQIIDRVDLLKSL